MEKRALENLGGFLGSYPTLALSVSRTVNGFQTKATNRTAVYVVPS